MLSRLVCRRNSGANGSRKAASSAKGSGEAFGTRVLFMSPFYHKTNKVVLVLSSLNPVRKGTPIVTPGLGRPSPDPGLGAPVELGGGHASRLLDLLGIGEALPCERITSKETPPALLQVQPAGPGGNKDVLDARMPFQPGTRLQAIMTAQVVGDNEDIARRIVRLDVLEEFNGVLGIARSRTASDLLAVTYPQRPVHPGFFRPSFVIERRFDAVAVG